MISELLFAVWFFYGTLSLVAVTLTMVVNMLKSLVASPINTLFFILGSYALSLWLYTNGGFDPLFQGFEMVAKPEYSFHSQGLGLLASISGVGSGYIPYWYLALILLTSITMVALASLTALKTSFLLGYKIQIEPSKVKTKSKF